MIDTDHKLADFLPELAAAPWVAVDTEADSLHAYPEKLCLLQISIPDRDVLVDPLSRTELTPLWEVLVRRELVFHAADYDLRLMAKHHSFVPMALFDTMLAARLIGCRQFGLANLVEQFLGLKLEKGPQKSDWARRPLTERMENYARNDTRHLQPLSDLLRQRLAEKGRLDWCAESCRRLIAESTAPVQVDEDLNWRIKGSAKLSRLSLAVLREIWHWREAEARRANKPPFFIFQHDALIRLADAAAHGGDWSGLIPRRYSPRRVEALRRALEAGLATPPARQPKILRGKQYFPTEREKARFTELRNVRDARATELDLDPTLIASKEVLLQLSRDDETAWNGLMNWQRGLLRP